MKNRTVYSLLTVAIGCMEFAALYCLVRSIALPAANHNAFLPAALGLNIAAMLLNMEKQKYETALIPGG